METLEDYLSYHAGHTPDKIAIKDADSTLSYRQLWEAVCAKASALESDASKACIVRAVHGFDFIITYFAAHKAGKVIVPLEKDLPDIQFSEIETLVKSAEIPESASDILFTTGMHRQEERDNDQPRSHIG